MAGKSKRKSLVILATGAFLASCAAPVTQGPKVAPSAIEAERAKQKQFVFDKSLSNQARVFDVGYRIRKANLEICEDRVGPKVGLLSIGINQVKNTQYKDIWVNQYGVDDHSTIVHVYEGSAAERAGLKIRDKILQINDRVIKPGRNATKDVGKAFDKELKSGGPLSVKISRNGVEQVVPLIPDQVCDFEVTYVQNDQINAWADGNNVYITSGIMNVIDNDDELALLLGHELGHNAMRHIQKKQGNQLAAGFGGLFIDILAAAAGVNTQGAFTDAAMSAGAMSFSVEFEQEADYVGTYMAKRAGYDTSQVANFWRKMALEHPRSIIVSTTHPTTPERFLAIEQTQAEIEQKVVANEPLLPNLIE